MKLLLRIFASFLRIGLFTFGGGYTMLPMFEREIIDRRRWIDHNELLDIYAASQSLPGAIALNAATFIGSKAGGVPGAVAASLGMVTPSIVVIVVVASLLSRLSDIPIAQYALKGMSAAVVALILHSAVRLGLRCIRTPGGLFVAAASLVLMLAFNVSVVKIVLGAVCIGTLLSLVTARLGKKQGKEGSGC